MADIQKMNLMELDAFLKRDDITDEQRAEAMIRMNEISTRDVTRPGSVPVPKPKPKPRGQAVAHGGKIHRGRKAQGNKD